jgi:uncharacterized membrane protein
MFNFIKFIMGLLGLILFIPLFIVLLVLCTIYLIFLIPVYFIQVSLKPENKDNSLNTEVETNLTKES